ncbi:ABC transporter substrate-binding protein [Pelagibacterium halotolerans]|uniref:Dipeptide-binding ABC transporter, periplasmic substrate-binding component n=1 Tax=Pelagibacterium halotolerans (strain DSM 22347 / JCM 15775 / CGMCC 1.7692 / B2) TaxID=1082931 RepID=G4R7C8_PELHB|nr:ABC transporter substrate-binding protein [Pelagibacterium halotolerans]AEQ51264.1 dipeptide-binding ABC transporter, periplasmic substrate-binding component [Pelagibacterium halotolerans B2]QJR18879.1 peptide ABC transporter substrate-binding protein [Pelagibacterium halotolerans]SEA66942.1 peptide/nickel transport system substrate-binding protein [Pelagibacterium halotolerans]
MRKTLIALAAVLAASVAMPAAAQIANDDDTLALAGLLDNNSFDRAQLMIANQIQYWQPVFDTLLVQAPDGSIEPNLATEYSYNESNSVLSLTLREGISFTDGTPFDAEAVKANLEYLAIGGGQNSFMAQSISQIEIVSPTEVTLHLGEPDPSLLQNLSSVGGAMASPANLGVEGSANNPIGSGPYIYDEAASVGGRQYVYNRNPDYWNADQYPFERVTITPINDLVARLNAIKSGQVDAGAGEASTVADAQANNLDTHANPVNWMGLTIADRGGEIVPALADVRVRQAINMAFDSAAILEFLQLGYGRLTDQIFPDTAASYRQELDAVYDYDPEGARALIAEAGYPDGFTVNMPELSGFANLNPVVAQQLAEIGITVEWTTIAPNATIPELRSGRYPIFLLPFGYQGDWAELTKFALPGSPWNPVGYEDPELLAMIEEAQYAVGDAQDAKYQEINTYLVDNAWFAPWYRPDQIYHTNGAVDVAVQAGNAVPFIRNYTRQQ